MGHSQNILPSTHWEIHFVAVRVKKKVPLFMHVSSQVLGLFMRKTAMHIRKEQYGWMLEFHLPFAEAGNQYNNEVKSLPTQ